MKILALGGSVRGNAYNRELLLKAVQDSEDLPSFLSKMRGHVFSNIPDTRKLSNSEILSGVALMGAKSEGAEVDFFPLISLFQRRETKVEPLTSSEYGLDEDMLYRDLLKLDPATLGLFTSKVEAADGIIFSSPVYFGDRSSVANKFIQLASKHGWLWEKVVSSVAVGTKRNGGQETTNIFYLYEALNHGAFVVGNGPKSCQYGGTGWAGDKGKILGDDFGIETTYGTGVRTAQVTRIRNNFPKESTAGVPLTIPIIVTMDTPSRKLHQFLHGYAKQLHHAHPWIQFRILELIDGDIDRCLACNICPIPKLLDKKAPDAAEDPYACIIQRKDDSMDQLRRILTASDGILLAGLNLKETGDVIYRYQAFMERTRFIRRNDFELTNIPMTGFLLNEVGAHTNPIHNLKVMTSFMRHNGIMMQPISATVHGEKVIESGAEGLALFTDRALRFKMAREKTDAIRVSYHALGYGDKTLDKTVAARKYLLPF